MAAQYNWATWPVAAKAKYEEFRLRVESLSADLLRVLISRPPFSYLLLAVLSRVRVCVLVRLCGWPAPCAAAAVHRHGLGF